MLHLGTVSASTDCTSSWRACVLQYVLNPNIERCPARRAKGLFMYACLVGSYGNESTTTAWARQRAESDLLTYLLTHLSLHLFMRAGRCCTLACLKFTRASRLHSVCDSWSARNIWIRKPKRTEKGKPVSGVGNAQERKRLQYEGGKKQLFKGHAKALVPMILATSLLNSGLVDLR